MIESCPKCRNLSELYRYPFGADEEPICYRCNCGIRSYCSSMFDYGFSYPHPNDKQTKKKYYLTVRIKLRDEFHLACVHFAVGEYWAGRGDAATAKVHHNIYLKKLGIIDLYPATAERQWQLKTEKE